MYEGWRFYYYLIFGALGGASGWFLGGLLAPAAGEPLAVQQQIVVPSFLQLVTFGCVLGATIGLSIAAYDGLASRSFKRAFMRGVVGIALGAVAGAVAMPASQSLYVYLMRTRSAGALWAFAMSILCWMLFGGLIGFIESVHKGTQSWKAFLGGVIGGIVGGATYQTAMSWHWENNDQNMRQIFLALSLAVLGGAIGASVVFVTTSLRQAFVEILNGKRIGDQDDLTKHVVRRKGDRTKPGLIGSDDWSANVYLPGDKGVVPHHAQISFINGAPTLEVLPEALKNSTTLVNGKSVTVCVLKDGDHLQVGSTNLIYHQKRK
jgi:uncharacterized membrane protein YeaQ/YmgE (transglycosylase-associated protein family)